MFRNAISITKNYTFNVLTSIRRVSGKVDTGLFTCILLDEDGNFLSCAHAFQIFLDFQKHQSLIKTNITKRAEIKTKGLTSIQEQTQLSKIRDDLNWITHIDFYLPKINASIDIKTTKLDFNKDLSTFKLLNASLPVISHYPIFFDNTNSMIIGASLCRLGYPFNDSKVSYKHGKGFVFHINLSTQDVYPNDGILTRIRKLVTRPKSRFSGLFIETSTPGLRGQSGCAMFDVDGVVYGIQSHTSHLPLDMVVPFPKNGPIVALENQVLNVGLGTHSTQIEIFLTVNGINYNKW